MKPLFGERIGLASFQLFLMDGTMKLYRQRDIGDKYPTMKDTFHGERVTSKNTQELPHTNSQFLSKTDVSTNPSVSEHFYSTSIKSFSFKSKQIIWKTARLDVMYFLTHKIKRSRFQCFARPPAVVPIITICMT